MTYVFPKRDGCPCMSVKINSPALQPFIDFAEKERHSYREHQSCDGNIDENVNVIQLKEPPANIVHEFGEDKYIISMAMLMFANSITNTVSLELLDITHVQRSLDLRYTHILMASSYPGSNVEHPTKEVHYYLDLQANKHEFVGTFAELLELIPSMLYNDNDNVPFGKPTKPAISSTSLTSSTLSAPNKPSMLSVPSIPSLHEII